MASQAGPNAPSFSEFSSNARPVERAQVGRKRGRVAWNDTGKALFDAGCRICLEPMHEATAVTLWSPIPHHRKAGCWARVCKHSYHKECALHHFGSRDECPLCRRRVAWLRIGWTRARQHDSDRFEVTTLMEARAAQPHAQREAQADSDFLLAQSLQSIDEEEAEHEEVQEAIAAVAAKRRENEEREARRLEEAAFERHIGEELGALWRVFLLAMALGDGGINLVNADAAEARSLAERAGRRKLAVMDYPHGPVLFSLGVLEAPRSRRDPPVRCENLLQCLRVAGLGECVRCLTAGPPRMRSDNGIWQDKPARTVFVENAVRGRLLALGCCRNH